MHFLNIGSVAFNAEGDWGFQAFFWKAWKKYPENPVNPVKKTKIK